MKKLLVIFTALILLIVSTISVSATDTVSFEISDCTCDKNRLFSVDMIAKSDIKLSAATFEFTYDKSLFEFRSIKVSNKESKISYNELENCVKAVFLNAFGQDIKNGDLIFTINFKSIESGNGQIGFTVSDCVSPDIEYIDIGTCTSGTVTVNRKEASESRKNDNSSKSDSEKDKSSKSKNSDKQTETTSVSTIDELGILNPVDDWVLRYFIAGICIGVGSVIVVLLIYFVPRKIIKKIKNKDNESSD